MHVLIPKEHMIALNKCYMQNVLPAWDIVMPAVSAEEDMHFSKRAVLTISVRIDWIN